MRKLIIACVAVLALSGCGYLNQPHPSHGGYPGHCDFRACQ